MVAKSKPDNDNQQTTENTATSYPAVTGCMRTTPTAAVEAIINLPPLHLFIKQEAATTAFRLKSLNLWNSESNTGHTSIISQTIAKQPLLALPTDRLVKIHLR